MEAETLQLKTVGEAKDTFIYLDNGILQMSKLVNFFQNGTFDIQASFFTQLFRIFDHFSSYQWSDVTSLNLGRLFDALLAYQWKDFVHLSLSTAVQYGDK